MIPLVNLQHDDLIDFPVTFKMVRRVMRELSLTCQIRVKKHSRHKENEQHIQDNVLNQNFDVDSPNQVWLSDSTELTYGVNNKYKVRLSGVLNLYGRRLLSYNLSATETSAAEIEVFQRAFESSGDVHPLVHTDRGSATPLVPSTTFLVVTTSHVACLDQEHHTTTHRWSAGGTNSSYGGCSPSTSKDLRRACKTG
ncbi:hypothetical protein [Amylolactobacillus amylophilus]|uniref:hypothetical protein n=1 Tax=Amylolactobacillus amylophilus TaxID=1603 RepID=UPI000ACDBB20